MKIQIQINQHKYFNNSVSRAFEFVTLWKQKHWHRESLELYAHR